MSEMWELGLTPGQAEVHDPIHEDEYEIAAFTGTCQGCGSYWDVRIYPRCPNCGGEVL